MFATIVVEFNDSILVKGDVSALGSANPSYAYAHLMIVLCP